MRQWVNIVVACALVCAWPCAAFAEEGTATGTTAVAAEAEPYKILAGETEIEKLSDEYEAARDELAGVDAKIAELQAQIDSLEADLPAQETRSNAAMRQRYIMQSNPLVIVESLLSSVTLGDFIKQSDYIDKISRDNLAELNRLRDMKSQLDQARSEQENVRAQAEARMSAAESALRAVQDERSQLQSEEQAFAARQAEVQGGANSIEKSESSSATANKKKTEAERKAEAEAAAKKAEEDAAKGILPPVEATTDTTGLYDGADWHADRSVFIETWAERIDKFLAGSPLEGQGHNFAAAAWKHGIDPRWSPAISKIESSMGAICIRPYNAWGWGASDSDPYGLALEWGSWEEAIDAHVKGLAEGYGYTVSMGRARTYCPPNWQRWYNSVVESMASMAATS
ncbi:MAG: hypothetical protein IJ087_16955 [Eggerthellaceae bacterium]|nr:hypothetical protein [Eggerthellaceae bacterium]